MSDRDHEPIEPKDPSQGPPWAWRFLVRAVVFCLTKLFGWKLSARIEGEVPRGDQPVVVVSNHTGYLEPFLLAHALWRLTGHWVQPLAKAELFRVPVFGPMARAAGGIPVERHSDEGRQSAYSTAVACLDQGGAIYIAPEGTTSHDGELLPLRHGAARLALEAGCSMLVVTHFGGQRAFSPVVRMPHRGAHFDLVIEEVELLPDDDETSITGRVAATMLDRSVELRQAYADQDVTAPWWPPYSEPAEPTRTARENIEQYRETMAEAIEQARERMAELAAERDLDARMKSARDRARSAAENARARAAELGDQLRHRSDELVELARSGQLGDDLRHRAEELSRQARLIAEHAAELRADLRESADHEDGQPPAPDEQPADVTSISDRLDESPTDAAS